jgi:hypothetical protein
LIFERNFISHRSNLKGFYKNQNYKVIMKDGKLVQNRSRDLLLGNSVDQKIEAPVLKMMAPGMMIDPPPEDGEQYKLVKYVNIVPRKYKENFEL